MFWINLDGTDGATLPLPSEAAFDAAIDWYNSTPKKVQIRYCLERRVDLGDPRNARKLVPYWADMSMAVYAWQQVDSKMIEILGLINADARQSLSEIERADA